MPKIGKRGQQRAVKALMNRLANFEKLHGATYNLCFAINRKTRLRHPILELQLGGDHIGDLCACTIYSPRGAVVARYVDSHKDDRLHRTAARMAALTIPTIRSMQLRQHKTRPPDREYEYLTEQRPRTNKMTVGETQLLTSKAAKNPAIQRLRHYLHAVEKTRRDIVLLSTAASKRQFASRQASRLSS
jgi:hypothetical protein